MSIDEKVICVSLLYEHHESIAYLPISPGYGNCYHCVYNPIDNPKCLGYNPVTIFNLEVKRERIQYDKEVNWCCDE